MSVEGELMYVEQDDVRTLGEFLEEAALAALPGCVARCDNPEAAAAMAWIVAEHFCIHAKGLAFERIEKIYSIREHED